MHSSQKSLKDAKPYNPLVSFLFPQPLIHDWKYFKDIDPESQ